MSAYIDTGNEIVFFKAKKGSFNLRRNLEINTGKVLLYQRMELTQNLINCLIYMSAVRDKEKYPVN